MQIVLQGSLAHFPPGEVLSWLSSHRHTGTLDVVSGEGRSRICFRDGEVVHAEASATANEQEILANLFLSEGATFTFLDEVALPDGARPASIDLKRVLSEGTRLVEERQRLRQLYSSEDITLRVVDDPRAGEKLDLTGEEFRILMKIGKGRTLAGLREDLQRTAADLYPVVHRLETNGLLQRVSQPDAMSVSPAHVEKKVHAIPVAPPPVAHDARTETGLPIAGSLTLATGVMFPLIGESYAIGRNAENTISIDDASVSSVHARILRTPKGFVIEDAQSRNGTHVNGERVTAPKLLADADTIRLGKVILTFHMAMPEPLSKRTVHGI